MKTIFNTFFLFLISLFLVVTSYAQNPLVKQWDYRFGGTHYDYLTCFQQTKDGGYILGGYSFSGISGDKTQDTIGGWDYWIIKTDSLGNKQWDKDFGGTGYDYLLSLQQTADGGYIFGGKSVSDSSGDKTQASRGDYDYWIIKTDSLGNKQWDKDFGGTSTEVLNALQQTADGGYIVGGYSFSGIGGDKSQPLWGGSDFWIVKTDSLGNKQWDKGLGGTSDDYFYSLKQTVDGGYIIGGYSYSGIGGNKTQASWGDSDFWIIKTDSAGNIEWDKDFGGTDGDGLVSLKQTSDRGYILGGYSYSNISGDKTQDIWGSADFWIIKTDSLGNKQWDKDFGGTDIDDFYTLFLTADGGYLFSGDSYSPLSGDKTENNLGVEQIWIVKTDSSGNKQWDKTIFTNGHDENGLAIQSSDGCYTLADLTPAGTGGYKTQASQGGTDYWIIKFCDSTTTTTGILTASKNPQSRITISPNPSNGIFQITFPTASSNQKTNYTLEVISTLGQTVYQAAIKQTDPDMHRDDVYLDVSFLVKGIYFLKINDSNRVLSQKLIIQ